MDSLARYQGTITSWPLGAGTRMWLIKEALSLLDSREIPVPSRWNNIRGAWQAEWHSLSWPQFPRHCVVCLWMTHSMGTAPDYENSKDLVITPQCRERVIFSFSQENRLYFIDIWEERLIWLPVLQRSVSSKSFLANSYLFGYYSWNCK